MRPVTFFRTLVNSLSSPKYYIDVLNVRFWFSVRFLVTSYILLTILASVLFLIIDTPKIERSLRSFVNQEITAFPEDYQLTWNGLQLQANTTETYTLPFPSLPDVNDAPPLLMQINPAVTAADQIHEHSKKTSFFFVGQTQLFLSQPGGRWSSMPLTDILSTSPTQITRQALDQDRQYYLDSTQSAVRMLPVIFPAFFFFFSFPFRFFNVLLDTLVIFLCVKLLGFPLTFKKALQISLHIMIVAELVSVLTASITTDLPMFNIAFWGYTAIVYWNLRHIQAMPIDALLRQEKDQS